MGDPHLLSSHSWKKVLADTWFFDDDIVRLEARALVKAANRAAHSQPLHDCKTLLVSDHLLVRLCFARGRSRDFNRNVKISIRWSPSDFNSSDRGSRDQSLAATSAQMIVGQSQILTHAPIVNPPIVKTKRSRHLTGHCRQRLLFRDPQCRGRRNGGLYALRAGQRQGRKVWKDPTSSR